MTQYTDRTGNRKAKAGSTSPDFAKSSCATIRVWCVAVLRGVRGGIFDREFSTGRAGADGGECKSGSARNDAKFDRVNSPTTCARHSKSTPPRVHCARATATMGKQNRQTKLKPPGAKSSGSSSSSQNLIPLLLSGAALLFALMMHPVLSKKLFGFGASDIPPPLDASSSQRHASSKTPSASCDAPDEGSVMCEAWHKAGRCRKDAEMLRLCPRTCGQCAGVPPRNPPVRREDRCSRANMSAAVPQYQLTPLFERIIAEFPQYEPEALSTSPYVLLLKNFLTASEAQAFLNVCQKSFERSLAGDQLNPVRTSFQCWCNFPECFADQSVHTVTKRINAMLGIPYNNGEDLQIVRYETGQFYRQHHDQNTAVWAPQGPRVLTFFMYLNEPESGGETRFPSIGPSPGLTVSPKLGHAILWPSTLDERPMAEDSRTLHEAMPVHEGIKYGANMWVHQFDFKTPSERGCELTYVNTFGNKPQSAEHAALVANGRVPDAEETVRMAKAVPPPS